MNLEKQKLFDQKGKIHNQMQDALRDVKKRDGIINTEERAKFDAWNAELEQVQAKIETIEMEERINLAQEAGKGVRLESEKNVEKKFNDAATSIERREALAKANKVGYASLSDAERVIVDTEQRDIKIFENFLRGKELTAEERNLINTKYREKRAQSVGTTTAGGYTVPEGFAGRIVELMAYVSDLINWGNIIRTDTGNTIPFPINDDNSNTGELIGENSDLSSASADLVFSVYNMGAYKMSSKLIKVSSELLQDNGVNLTDYLAKKLAIRVGKVANTYYTTGTGSSQPKGFLQTRGAVTSSTSTFTLAEMASFQDSIDPAYRSSNKIAWSMHSNLLSEIKALALAATAYGQVWAPSFRDGEPDRLLGKPYFLNQAMSSTSATGDKIMAYGDWSKFNIRIVNDFTLKILSERYAEYDQLAFFGLMRTDSFLEDTTAVKYFEIS